MKRTVLGLYLTDQTAQALALEYTTNGITVQALAEWSSSLFSYAGDDTPGVDDFVDRLSAFIREHNLTPSQVSATIDSSLMFINTIPITPAATRNEIDERVRWELNEYFPNLTESFISDIHVLANKQNEIADSIMMVAIRRDMVQKLHRSLSRLHLKLEVVDVDHFSADTALRFNYPDAVNKFVAFVGLKEQRIDVSLLRNTQTESYYYRIPKSEDEIVKYITSIASETPKVSSISLYGTHLTRELLARLRSATTIPIETVNPFRMIDVAGSVRRHEDPTITSYRFCSVVGVALRRD